MNLYQSQHFWNVRKPWNAILKNTIFHWNLKKVVRQILEEPRIELGIFRFESKRATTALLGTWFYQKSNFMVHTKVNFGQIEKYHTNDLGGADRGKNWVYHMIPTKILLSKPPSFFMLEILKVKTTLSTLWSI